uniref:Uncharacterized protein n=1 Tax=Setaria viridis TaxID=4556 RepID=A0A4U6ULJ6_SETVI|nr:hypothetical protein SEVIR_6G237144v2 [Setaria viridis]
MERRTKHTPDGAAAAGSSSRRPSVRPMPTSDPSPLAVRLFLRAARRLSRPQGCWQVAALLSLLAGAGAGAVQTPEGRLRRLVVAASTPSRTKFCSTFSASWRRRSPCGRACSPAAGATSGSRP